MPSRYAAESVLQEFLIDELRQYKKHKKFSQHMTCVTTNIGIFLIRKKHSADSELNYKSQH